MSDPALYILQYHRTWFWAWISPVCSWSHNHPRCLQQPAKQRQLNCRERMLGAHHLKSIFFFDSTLNTVETDASNDPNSIAERRHSSYKTRLGTSCLHFTHAHACRPSQYPSSTPVIKRVIFKKNMRPVDLVFTMTRPVCGEQVKNHPADDPKESKADNSPVETVGHQKH